MGTDKGNYMTAFFSWQQAITTGVMMNLSPKIFLFMQLLHKCLLSGSHGTKTGITDAHVGHHKSTFDTT